MEAARTYSQIANRNGEGVWHFAHKNSEGEIVAACGAKTNNNPAIRTTDYQTTTCHRCVGINGRASFHHMNNI